MFYDITLWIITSLILIILIHYLFNFFKDTLTTPKVKDLVEQPLMRYKNIEKITNDIEPQDIIGTTKIDEIVDEKITTNSNENDMKNELKNFFNELKEQNSINTVNNNFGNSFDQKLYSEIR
jgi:hypothetical protein